MKYQAFFSSKDESRNNRNVVCCSFARVFMGYELTFIEMVGGNENTRSLLKVYPFTIKGVSLYANPES